jgi:hypothetical protein
MPIPNRSAGLVVGEFALLRIHRRAAYLHALGPRAVAEFLAELAGGPEGPTRVLALLDRYGRLTREMILAAGADRPLLPQLRAVP